MPVHVRLYQDKTGQYRLGQVKLCYVMLGQVSSC